MTAQPSFFAPTADQSADAAPQQAGYSADTGRACRPTPCAAVGELSPEELDAHIASLGQLMAKSHRLGDRAGALELQRLMFEAIRARSPQHQAAMEQAIRSRIEDPCYFSSDAAHSLTGGAA